MVKDGSLKRRSVRWTLSMKSMSLTKLHYSTVSKGICYPVGILDSTIALTASGSMAWVTCPFLISPLNDLSLFFASMKATLFFHHMSVSQSSSPSSKNRLKWSGFYRNLQIMVSSGAYWFHLRLWKAKDLTQQAISIMAFSSASRSLSLIPALSASESSGKRWIPHFESSMRRIPGCISLLFKCLSSG